MNIDKTAINEWIDKNGRPIDQAWHKNDVKGVLEALKTYQNPDGGFAHAIEPDLRLPQSTALATWMGFQIIKTLNIDPTHPVVANALHYFINTYDWERTGWPIVIPEVDDHPHAPWWTYKAAMEHFGWGNPSAEILGLLTHYKTEGIDEIKQALEQQAIERIAHVSPDNFHEVLNFKALYELAEPALQDQLREPVRSLIDKATNRNKAEWHNYVATPLTFVQTPRDPFIDLFTDELIEENITFLKEQLHKDHWQPHWNWSGLYKDDWSTAKQEWSSYQTDRNLRLRDQFNA